MAITGLENIQARSVTGIPTPPDRVFVNAGSGGRTLAEVEISAPDRARLDGVLDDLARKYGAAENPRFLREAPGMSHLLPDNLGAQLRALRYAENASALVVRGGPVSTAPCPTPAHWSERERDATTRHDFWLTLVAAQLGDPVCWSSLQDARLLNDIVPVAGHESAQTGLGSRAELEFRVEDAYDDDRCDFLGLLALRNQDHVATTVAAIDPRDVEILREPRFVISADPEHLRGLGSDMPRRRQTPVLFGSPTSPYLRVDPAYTVAVTGDVEAEGAFARLCRHLAAGQVPVVLEPGDLLFIDNYRSVHGRKPFQPRYDGTDRWLRKATVVRDLRRSRARRHGADGRVLDVV